MSEPKQPRQAWVEVGRQFEELGRALGEHFSRPDAATWQASSAEGAERDERQRVVEALRKAGEAAQQLGDQAGEAVRDPELRERARSATRGLADALETTFGQLAEQLRGRTGAARPEDDAWSGSTDPDAPRAVVEPVPVDGPGTADAPGAAGDGEPQSSPGPDPDPAPGEPAVAPEQAPTRPPSDS